MGPHGPGRRAAEERSTFSFSSFSSFLLLDDGAIKGFSVRQHQWYHCSGRPALLFKELPCKAQRDKMYGIGRYVIKK
ncbi:hypothetical protein EYF80_026870 [Liparis tanakae]|uniref:Uncharacterized protein n=1 Tax=Liparis tanakae TaxID=230148 RepID=A0A4Z2HAL3_9TELE|nr:hypothetical protein EYF80_026870 [Liparis tanakae]